MCCHWPISDMVASRRTSPKSSNQWYAFSDKPSVCTPRDVLPNTPSVQSQVEEMETEARRRRPCQTGWCADLPVRIRSQTRPEIEAYLSATVTILARGTFHH